MAQRQNLNPQLKKKLARFKKAVKANGVRQPQIILFGSWAKNKAKPHSDIDVCVISPSFSSKILKNEIKLKMLTIDIDPSIEPVAYSPQDFQADEDPFAYEIRNSGIVI